jgi:hypothetical protein
MRSRRSLLAGLGASVFSLGAAGKLRSERSPTRNPYVESITIESRAGNVDADARRERLVWVRFVPKRRLVAVRLEARVTDAVDPAIARTLRTARTSEGSGRATASASSRSRTAATPSS